jgi:hypothetical protein
MFIDLTTFLWILFGILHTYCILLVLINNDCFWLFDYNEEWFQKIPKLIMCLLNFVFCWVFIFPTYFGEGKFKWWF